MKTRYLDANTKSDITIAAKILKDGGLVGIPTETVYGLAANALDGNAVAKIFTAKGRPMDNPLIVHISKFDDIYPLVRAVPDSAKSLARHFWPGPLTMILPKADCIPDEVSAGLDTVAVRFPSHPAARAVIEECGFPLAAPSANTSGRPSPTLAHHVLDDMEGKIDAILDGGPCDVGVESTVITLAGSVPALLRPGGVTLEELRGVLGRVDMDDAVLNPLKDGVKASSPGMKYKHYSPEADVIIVDGTGEEFIEFVNSHAANGVVALCCDGDTENLDVPCVSFGQAGDYNEMARELFDALRTVDEIYGAKIVYARCPEPKGVGLAVYNRLVRAAGFQWVKLGNV